MEKQISISGIYKFENKINHHIYIGQSVNITQRYKDHLNRYKNNFTSNNEYDSAIHRALRKYGLENFSFEIIEECPNDTTILNEREIFWINYYNSYNDGYNETPGGDQPCPKSCKLTYDLVENIKYDLINTNMTYDELHKKYLISTGRISEINTGKIWIDNNLNYSLRKPKLSLKMTCPRCGKKKDDEAQYCLKCYTELFIHQYPVSREELKSMIRTQPFTKIGEKYKVTDNTIRKWCDGYKLPRKKIEINKISDKDWELI